MVQMARDSSLQHDHGGQLFDFRGVAESGFAERISGLVNRLTGDRLFGDNHGNPALGEIEHPIGILSQLVFSWRVL